MTAKCKRCLALLLAAVMLVGLLPSAALAAGTSLSAHVTIQGSGTTVYAYYYNMDGTIDENTVFQASDFSDVTTSGYHNDDFRPEGKAAAVFLFVVPNENHLVTQFDTSAGKVGGQAIEGVVAGNNMTDYPGLKYIAAYAKENLGAVALFTYSRKNTDYVAVNDTLTVNAVQGGLAVEATSNVTADQTVRAGDVITYTVTLTPTEVDGATTQLSLSTLTVGGVEYAGQVTPQNNGDGTYTVTLDYTVTQDDADSGTVTLSVTGTTTYSRTATANISQAQVTTVSSATASTTDTASIYRPYLVTYNNGGHGTLTGQNTSGNVVYSCEKGSATPAAPGVTANTGWYFTGWDKTIAATVTQDVTYTAQWTQSTDIGTLTPTTVYRVEHYRENLDGTYTLAETEFPLYAALNSTATATAKTYDHYTRNTTKGVASGTVVTPTVAADKTVQTLTLSVYYDLDRHTVTFNAGDHGSYANDATSVSGTYQYGAAFPTAITPTGADHYVFDGWYDAAGNKVETFPTTVTQDVTYTAHWTQVSDDLGDVTPVWGAYKVEHYLENADGTYTLADTDFPLYGQLNTTVTAAAKTYAGYALDTANADAVASGTVFAPTVAEGQATMLTLKLYYAPDTVRDPAVNPDETASGDGIPDKYQVTVTYASSNTSYGTVNKTSEVFTLTDGNGGYVTTGSVDAGASAATVGSRDSLTGWTLDGQTIGTALDLAHTIENAVGGQTYAIVANFRHASSSGGSNRPTTDITDPDVPTGGDANLNDEDHFAYVKGYPDGTVQPTGNITRAEVATIFYRLLDDTSRAMFFTAENDFSDVADTYWGNKAISTLANAGILEGYPDGTFQANRSITRAEFAAIAARFEVVTEDVENPFRDTAGHWGEKLISFAASKGWVTGYPDGTFLPNQSITRAEAMTLINRVLNRAVDEAGLLADATQWPDNTADKWYYLDVLEATNTHDYERRTEGETTENWTQLRPDPTWDEDYVALHLR